MTAPEEPTARGGTHPQHGTGQESVRLSRILDELVERVPSIQHALVLAADGLPRGASRSLGREDGEQLAAVASGFHSLARGVGQHFETGSVRQTLVELDHAFLLVTAAGAGSALAVFADAEADIGQVAYEMALLVKRVGSQLSTAPRSGPDGGDVANR